jgi:hypothetical protein
MLATAVYLHAKIMKKVTLLAVGLVVPFYSFFGIFFALPTTAQQTKQCSPIEYSKKHTTKNFQPGSWLATGNRKELPINRILYEYAKTDKWEIWEEIYDSTGCLISEQYSYSDSKTYLTWEGAVNYGS